MTPTDLAPFVVTLETARRDVSDIPKGPPVENRRLAALVVSVQGIRRSFEESPEADSYDAGRHGPLAPLQEPTELEPREFVWYHRRTDDEAGPVVATKVVDRPVFLRSLFIPSLPVRMSYRPLIENASRYFQSLPEILRVPGLEDALFTQGDRWPEGAPSSFHGYEFDDTVQQARETLRKWTDSRTHLKRVEVWAWPMLWLRFQAPDGKGMVDILVTPERSGELRSLMSVSSR